MSESTQPYDSTPLVNSAGQLDHAAVRARVNAALTRVERHSAITHAPLSPLHVTRKMGFKDVVYCDCGSVLDLNMAEARRQRKAWVAIHQEHLPKRETDAAE